MMEMLFLWSFTFLALASAEVDWYESWLFKSGYRLIDGPTKDGSYPVMFKEVDGDNITYHPICADGFNDRTAQALCQMYTYDRGIRATYKVESASEFIHTGLSCFDSMNDIEPHEWKGDLNVYWKDTCSWEVYSEKSVPCSRNQAAAVYCHDLGYETSYHFEEVFTRKTDRKFKITGKIQQFKHGRIFSFFGMKGLKEDMGYFDEAFSAEACGHQYKPSVKIDTDDRSDVIELSGKFKLDCDQCVDVFMLGEYLFDVC